MYIERVVPLHALGLDRGTGDKERTEELRKIDSGVLVFFMWKIVHVENRDESRKMKS